MEEPRQRGASRGPRGLSRIGSELIVADASGGASRAPFLRAALDRLYLWGGYAAAFFLVCIALAVIAQVGGRMLGWGIPATKIAGFFLAASSFLALPHALRQGSHVRVTLLIHRLGGRVRQGAELSCCIVAAAVIGYVAYNAALMNAESYRFGDIVPGLLAIPFWIPQLAMTAGLILLEIALIDEMVGILRGRDPSYETDEGRALD